MRSGGATASGAVTRAGWSGRGLPAPFERDPRNPLDRRARGVPADPGDATAAAATGDRIVTAKVTRTSTTFRPTTLDIEHLFGLVSASATEQTFCRTSAPDDTTQSAPGKEPSEWHSSVSNRSRSRSAPTGSAVARARSPGATSDSRHPPRRRPRGGGRLSGHHRPADAVRGRDASRPAVADLPAPLAALDGDRPRRGGPSPGGLIANTASVSGAGVPRHRPPTPDPPSARRERRAAGRARRYRAPPRHRRGRYAIADACVVGT